MRKMTAVLALLAGTAIGAASCGIAYSADDKGQEVVFHEGLDFEPSSATPADVGPLRFVAEVTESGKQQMYLMGPDGRMPVIKTDKGLLYGTPEDVYGKLPVDKRRQLAEAEIGSMVKEGIESFWHKIHPMGIYERYVKNKD